MQNVILCIKIAFFFQKITKNYPATGGFALRPSSVMCLNYNALLLTTRLPIETFSHFKYWFKPSSLNEFLVTCQLQATASDLPFHNIFAPTNNFSFEVSGDVIPCDLWFGPLPQSKILSTSMMPC